MGKSQSGTGGARCGRVRVSLHTARLVRFAQYAHFAPKEAGRIPDDVLLVCATRRLLAVSRRDGGLLSRPGVLKVGVVALGILCIFADEELHLVLMDLGRAAVRQLLEATREAGRLGLLLVTDEGDARLMLPPVDHGVDLLIAAASQDAQPAAPAELAQAAAQATRYLASDPALAGLGPGGRVVESIAVSLLQSDSEEEEAEEVRTLH